MAVIKLSELREMDANTLKEKVAEIARELRAELGAVRAGGRATNPGRIREMRRTIARVFTIMKEKKLS